MSGQGTHANDDNVDSNPSMAEPTLVSNNPADVYSQSDSTPTMPESIDVPTGGTPSTDGEQQPTAGRMASIRGSYGSQGFSQRVTSLLLSSWSSGTNISYNSAWSKWNSWCSERAVNPLHAPLAVILDFLADLHAKGLYYSTINLHRSAISSCHVKVDGFQVGEHPLVKRLMRGIYRVSPPLPRYSHTWEVDKVLTYLKSLGPNISMTLKNLTLKLTMLLALTAAKRCSELARLDCRFMNFTRNESVTFVLPGLSKSKKLNVSVTFHSFPSDRLLCAVDCLNEYLVRTEQFRLSDDSDPLLLSFIKPHNSIKPCTVARWLRMVMKDAGIDTSIFKAHSTRSASSSKVHNMGVSTADIMKTANWSCQSTFTKFYMRNSVAKGDDFSKAVLRL
ncbi:hypothetical protein FSP39_002051 [Pinctada imbricata]|uniref:Tyr recombinase domain-containing protein n=1 Tax=Pinctada imbricata TaxID=66713 RepID=A0AA88Y9J7_PINIB|nr:hypothetical protein FSP39_002051 [Pinctada imbricata]